MKTTHTQNVLIRLKFSNDPKISSVSGLFDGHLSQDMEIIQRLSGTKHNGG
jgi:hypothetical protein